jgi:hypothetical protein
MSFGAKRHRGSQWPFGIDYAWLACDVNGQIARFTNAGDGPIPTAVLDAHQFADRAEMLTRALPIVGEAEMRVSLPDPTDYRDIARRGLYAYDWLHADQSPLRGGYEIVSRPLRPLLLDELPVDLRQLAELVQFGPLPFRDCDLIYVAALVDCEW